MAKIKNTDFFKTGPVITQAPAQENAATPTAQESGTQPEAKAESAQAQPQAQSRVVVPRKITLSSVLLKAVESAGIKLNEIGFPAFANDMAGLFKLAVNKRFTVAFVGEFSRGKSTLVNRILGKDLLPVGNLPTTAVLTRILYGNKPQMTVCDKDGKRLHDLPVRPESWEGLTAANFGEKEPEGTVIMHYPDKWLGEYAIDIIDTPGAGDLEDKRARLIERSMVQADAAIIAIDASKALSQTEQHFIHQNIISRGVPFVALAITKLDLVNPQERAKVISYLLTKLKSLNISMPIVIADDNIEIPDFDTLQAPNVYIGIQKLKQMIVAWMANENRTSLMERWLSINALAIVNAARAFLLQQKEIMYAKDVDREKLIRQRSNALSEMHSNWEELRKQMETRCAECVAAFHKAAQEAGEALIESLQHEADRQPNPKDWLEKEYSYRVKRELSAISLSLDNLVSKRVTTDMRWLNTELNKQFKEIIGTEVASLMAKEDFLSTVDDKALTLASLKDKSMMATAVSAALTIGAGCLMGLTGGLVLLATMGVGTTANLLSRRHLDKEGAKQREALKQLIAQQIPGVIKEASADSETKIKIIYHDIISESHQTEAQWMSAQRSLIREAAEKPDKAAKEQLAQKITALEQLVTLFS